MTTLADPKPRDTGVADRAEPPPRRRGARAWIVAGASLGDAVEGVEEAQGDMGAPGDVHGSFQGTAQAFEASLASQPMLILAALAVVYIVLGVL